MPLRSTLRVLPFLVLLLPSVASASDVHALFGSDRHDSPFPSDRFTVADPTQKTGRRVDLPMPPCDERPSDCEDVRVIDTLDGFNIQPRLSIPFDGPIDVYSVTSQTVFLVRLGCPPNSYSQAQACNSGPHPGTVGINQIVWDTYTNTLHVESDRLLEQHTRYALIVTRGLRDAAGRPVAGVPSFHHFRQTVRGAYKDALLAAIQAARKLGLRESQIAVASVFTTQSVTSTLERIRDQIKGGTPQPADFLIGPDGAPAIFPFDDLTGISWRRHTTTMPTFNVVEFNLAQLRSIPGAVGQLAFGRFHAPEYRTSGGFIPAVGTRTGVPAVHGTSEIYFNLVLPRGTPPPDGWPVAIAGHGGDGSKENLTIDAVGRIAAALAKEGIATIAINAVGHGAGPLGTLTVNRTNGAPVTISSGGRGIDQNGDQIIGTSEGIRAARPRALMGDTDGFRQTVADLMQLVRVIERGVDLDGDLIPDLDASRIYYVGQSQAAMYGTVFLAVEPSVRAGVLTAGGGPRTSIVLNAVGGRAGIGAALAERTPSLINGPGVTHLDDVALPGLPLFNENMPLRDGVPLAVGLSDGSATFVQSPVVNTVPGAMELQEFLDNMEWVGQAANPVAHAPFLRKAPLPGMAAKSVLVQFAKGDRFVPNPATTAVLRAGGLSDRATYYRHDLASLENPALPKPAHGFMVGTAGFGDVARGAQNQIAIFLATDGELIVHPEPTRFFETPIAEALPEGLNFVR